jgi:hypothetical protein
VAIVKGEDGNADVKLLNNPATATLSISYRSDKQINSTLKVYSISGAQVYQTKLNASAGKTTSAFLFSSYRTELMCL